MLFRYGYYLDSVFADSYEEACEHFAALYPDYFDEEEVWEDDE